MNDFDIELYAEINLFWTMIFDHSLLNTGLELTCIIYHDIGHLILCGKYD